jgi:predicted RNA-binding protein associated with RNAse of E/G family
MKDSEITGEELTRRRDHIDELARRLERGDITQEFYDKAFKEQYEIEKKYGLLVPGSWLWDSMLDDLNAYNLKKSQEAQE